MLPDPFTIAANAPTPQLTMAVIKSDGYGSERTETGGALYTCVINHSTGKSGNRHYVKLTLSKDAVNPYTSLTSKQLASVSMAISRPPFGFTDTEMVDLVEALRDLVFDTEVTPLKLLQFQS